MTRWMLVAVLGLAACGMSEDEYKTCELLTECTGDTTGVSFGFESAADCETFYGAFFGLGTSGCDYDAKAAKECVAELQDATCDGSEGSGTSACNDVYTGAACGFGGTTSSTTGTFTFGTTTTTM